MPVLSTFYGIIIHIYANDHNPPHIHARYGEYESSFTLDGELMNGEIPKKQRKLVEAWIALYSDEIYANWQLIQMGEPITKITPLR